MFIFGYVKNYGYLKRKRKKFLLPTKKKKIKNRLDKKEEQLTYYKDWFILGVVFALGLTGMLTEMARLAHLEFISYFFYYLHLIAIFELFAFLPFSKMAHLVYRLTAMTYAEYSDRK